MNTAAKGRRAEHRARRTLEAAGYCVIRSAASKGPFDLIAMNGEGVRLINVKSGGRYACSEERRAMLDAPRPPGATLEVWRFIDGIVEPRIEQIRTT